jgi:long-chain acyl-CoA synthetase
MREATGSKSLALPEHIHLLDPVMRWASDEPGRAVMAYRDGDRFVDITAGDLRDRIWAVARGLIASGVQPGDRVALMSHTRLEWPIVDYAILAAGGVTVPVYETSSAEQLQWILSDSGAVMLVIESAALRKLYDEVAEAVPDCREVLVIDDGALDELSGRGEGVDDAEIERRLGAITGESIATVIYTSGTTGRPKGCVLTHGNLRTNVLQNIDAMSSMLGPDERSLLFLPLAHSLAKIILLVCMEHGIRCAFCSDARNVVQELPMAKPTMVVSVPRVFEKVFNGAQHKAHSEGKGRIFDKAADVAIDWARQRTEGRVRPLTGIAHAVFDKLVYGKLRAVFGSDLRLAFSGGGPLGERLTLFFDGIGVRICEGYGLTETSPTLTVNRADAWRPGTVGQPLADTTIRIADDGEIVAKGPQVFSGYWKNEAATAEVFDDGWFLTGDIGELGDEGHLRITGRKKDLIVTAAGKNVAPAPLEDHLRAHALVSQAIVLGDGRPFIAALLTLDEEAVGQWATARGREGATAAQLAADEEMRTELQGAVDAANRSVSRAESIRKFTVLERDLTIEDGELTPTLKVRRVVVEKAYAAEIDSLYTPT